MPVAINILKRQGSIVHAKRNLKRCDKKVTAVLGRVFGFCFDKLYYTCILSYVVILSYFHYLFSFAPIQMTTWRRRPCLC